MFTDDDLDTMQLVRCAFDPRRAGQPGQDLPDAAAVRRACPAAHGRAPAAARPAWRRCSDGRTGSLDRSEARRPRPADAATRSAACRPGWSRAPGRPAEAAAVLRAAARHGLRVVARGAGTKLGWGAAADARSTWSSTPRGSTGVVEHAAGDLVVGRPGRDAAGRPADALAAAGQRLALDEPVPGATVGGVVATAPAGRAGCCYGTRARPAHRRSPCVRADGVVAKAGGKVVKNVAGYDLGKLLTGSYGTLGLITEATFRLHPLPGGRASSSAATPTRRRAGRGAAVARRRRSCRAARRGRLAGGRRPSVACCSRASEAGVRGAGGDRRGAARHGDVGERAAGRWWGASRAPRRRRLKLTIGDRRLGRARGRAVAGAAGRRRSRRPRVGRRRACCYAGLPADADRRGRRRGRGLRAPRAVRRARVVVLTAPRRASRATRRRVGAGAGPRR